MWLQRSYVIFMPAVRLIWPMRALGAENVPQTGPVILAPNHESFLDPWLLASISPRRPVAYLTNSEWYYRSWFWQLIFSGCGCIPQAKNPIGTIQQVVDAVKAGVICGVFPEGRISADGKLTRLQHGIGWIAALSGVPVVPTAVHGSYESLPRHKKFPDFSRINFEFAAPLVFPGSPTKEPAPEAVHEFVCKVGYELARMKHQLDRLDEILPEAPAADLRAVLAHLEKKAARKRLPPG